MSNDDIEVEAAPAAASTELSQIAAIAERQLAAANKVSELAEALKNAEKELKVIAESELPTAMLSIGMREFTLDSTGHRFSIVTSHHASLTDERKPAAFAWLREHGLDDIIKRELTVSFGRGEGPIADAVAAQIKEAAPSNKFADKASIHYSTLGSFVRERIANGDALPFDIFGVYSRTVAEVVDPNAKKERVRKNAPSLAAMTMAQGGIRMGSDD